ncbi:hypothetical protein I3843_07G192200 [Carya illinoinensis]|uniref:DUF4228 domain-containing protein n=1 Tax=Carya illinoinensis TaxID=32201 RepID=A0A8T1Q4U9_CARIL|nr:uncharacterized protein LOC122316402 [Carya illinoinensis]KAG2699460.1 hypothetical protein I3760_07G193100 [Carya illinoinensis]KAG6649203.1 hypothetical protein CIPAW_07G196100 [Carya illinoinensis]KAG6705865.1 hypothetical protein I3842_07G198800 [Carya illinoinensis]KAG7972621.1 hypothetical protein I3843_07G192200 [Carya illinoinensis]
MGACFSCRSSAAFKSIRVVHFNGFVEDFENPVSVSQVTGKPPKHFVCTPAQLLSTATASNYLKPDTQLEPGKLYFLLPYSTLQAEISPLDLASIAKRLIKVAKTNRSQAKSSRASPSISPYGSSPVLNSPSRSPNRFGEPEVSMVALGATQRSSRARSWKPILDPIRERSFNRTSESDLQEKHSDTGK